MEYKADELQQAEYPAAAAFRGSAAKGSGVGPAKARFQDACRGGAATDTVRGDGVTMS
jgi:hypothetical protein